MREEEEEPYAGLPTEHDEETTHLYFYWADYVFSL